MILRLALLLSFGLVSALAGQQEREESKAKAASPQQEAPPQQEAIPRQDTTPTQNAAPEQDVAQQREARKSAPNSQQTIKSAELRFQGNENISNADLERAAVNDLADLEKRGFRRAEVDDAAYAMEYFYLSKGYPFARVRYDYQVEGEKLIASFIVKEGPFTTLAEVKIEGNTVIPSNQLQTFFLSSEGGTIGEDAGYVESAVTGAPGSIRSAYITRGYLDVTVEPAEIRFNQERTRAWVELVLEEGVRYFVKSIVPEGNQAVSRDKILEAVRDVSNTAFWPRKTVELRSKLEELYGDEGYPSAEIEVVRQDGKDGAVTLTAKITEGPRVRLRNILVSGNDKTSEGFIRSRLGLESGEYYSRKRQREAFVRLFSTGLFRRIEIDLEGEGPEQDLRVVVEEAPSQSVSLEPGWGSYEKARLKLGYRENNLFGTGRKFRTELAVSLVGYGALAGVTDPWFLGTALTLDVPVYYRQREEQAFTRTEFGTGILFSRSWTRQFSTTFGYQLRQSNVSQIQGQLPRGITAEDLRIASVSVEPRHDTRNDLFNPSTGHKAWIQLEYGDGNLGSELDFFRVDLGFAQFFSLAEDTVFAGAVRSGVILPVGDTREIPLQERFYNGGENTVRSFSEAALGPTDLVGQPLGGETRSVINLELRQRLVDQLYGAAFLDIGNVGLEPSNYLDNFRLGTGVGLRYLLPVGAVRLDLGVNPSPRVGEADFRIHFAVGMAF